MAVLPTWRCVELSREGVRRLPRGAIQDGAERSGRCAARRTGRGLLEPGSEPLRATERWVRPPCSWQERTSSRPCYFLFIRSSPLHGKEEWRSVVLARRLTTSIGRCRLPSRAAAIRHLTCFGPGTKLNDTCVEGPISRRPGGGRVALCPRVCRGSDDGAPDHHGERRIGPCVHVRTR